MKNPVPPCTKPIGYCRALISFFFGCLLALPLSAATITGIVVSSVDNTPLVGASILIEGTAEGTITDLEGNFSLEVDDPEQAVLIVSYVGYETLEVPVAGRSLLTITLRQALLPLEEVVVTGYTTQRKGDITGAVSVVDVEQMDAYKAPGFAQKLEGQVAGLQIYTSGEPGSPTNIRIRGFSSFTDNNPLIIVDGVPVTDRFLNWLNPNDIASIQVLKDASAASIYGARANNGVIIVETKKGKAGKTRVSYDGYAGLQEPVGRWYDILIQDPLEYGQYLWQFYQNAGLVPPSNLYGSGPEPVVPEYVWPDNNVPVDESTYSYPDNPITRANKTGTNWENEVLGAGFTTDHNLRVSGGTDRGTFGLSAGYLRQNGTRKFNYLERYTVRVNSEFKAGPFNFGENITLVRRETVSPNVDIAAFPSIMPVYDIAGKFSGSKAPGTGGVNVNPLASVTRQKDNNNESFDMLGNVFAELEIARVLSLKTSLGFNFTQSTYRGFNFPDLVYCPNCTNSLDEFWSKSTGLTWTNTLNYKQTFNRHALQALAGYEVIETQARTIYGGLTNYITEDINAWYLNTSLADPETRQVTSGGDLSRILSLFGKVDYQFDDKYLFSFTLRYDGSSKFGRNKYGAFPAVSLGWRLSREPFMQGLSWLSDLKLRVGVGVTGGQNIPSGNAFNRYGGRPSDSVYDLYGTNNSIVTGYALTSRGNDDTRWERNRSVNAGLDFSVLADRLGLVFDWYIRDVDGLLFNPALPGTAGSAAPPYINIAAMRNTGFDLALRYRSRAGRAVGLEASLNLGHYRNEILQIDGQSDFFFGPLGRTGQLNIHQIGYPISGFYGYFADGIFQNQEEVDAHADQPGKAVGRLRFRDVNQDGVVNDEDRGVIGHPHPDLTIGFNLGMTYKGVDFSIFLAGPIGNQLYNHNRVFYEFGLFGGNVSREVLTNSWTPENPGARIPRLDISDSFSPQSSTYYLEDGSYIRAKTILLGYSLPTTIIRRIKLERLRVYVQAQNAFTITSYSGVDPAVPNFGGGEDISTGYDMGYYPAAKMFSVGVNLGF